MYLWRIDILKSDTFTKASVAIPIYRAALSGCSLDRCGQQQ